MQPLAIEASHVPALFLACALTFNLSALLLSNDRSSSNRLYNVQGNDKRPCRWHILSQSQSGPKVPPGSLMFPSRIEKRTSTMVVQSHNYASSTFRIRIIGASMEKKVARSGSSRMPKLSSSSLINSHRQRFFSTNGGHIWIPHHSAKSKSMTLFLAFVAQFTHSTSFTTIDHA